MRQRWLSQPHSNGAGVPVVMRIGVAGFHHAVPWRSARPSSPATQRRHMEFPMGEVRGSKRDVVKSDARVGATDLGQVLGATPEKTA